MYIVNIKNKTLIIILTNFRSSTPILNRANEEPVKAPTIDLFDMLNTTDYREEQYIPSIIF